MDHIVFGTILIAQGILVLLYCWHELMIFKIRKDQVFILQRLKLIIPTMPVWDYPRNPENNDRD